MLLRWGRALANQRHGDILLRDGVALWDLWRIEESDIRLDLRGADLRRAILSEADLTRAHLSGAMCLRTTFAGATLTGCTVYGISAWDSKLDEAVQADVRINPRGPQNPAPSVTVANLEVAQFLYLLKRLPRRIVGEHDDRICRRHAC